MSNFVIDKKKWNFENLVKAIHLAHQELAMQASRAVNVSLTLRNWMIGCYIVEYELNGADRAGYGDKLLAMLADELENLKVSNCNKRQLYRYMRFYRFYPQIVGTLTPQISKMLPSDADCLKMGTLSPQLHSKPKTLLHKLAYSHIDLLVNMDDELQRTFYEFECIRGNWSVRELKRQIGSLYYERTGLSRNKNKLAKLARQGAETADPRLSVRDPYIFEFLGLKPKEVMSESHLEDHLLDKIQEFMLELGHGFCFEARQKRILIGDEHFFVDLVFYHRILKCHVLLEMKLADFSHENIGQLNTYVSWYQANIMAEGDNPPVGILLCTGKNHALVEYALAGMDNQLFVSRYLLEMPDKGEMQRFVEEQMKDSGVGQSADDADKDR